MKKVTIITSTFNVADYIDICMDHLLHQTLGLENIEIILVDDASTDNGRTLSKLKKYEEQYPDNIILICNDTNLKPGGCRNIALQYASGEYIAYCDADDWVSFDAYEILYNIAKYYDCDVVEFGHTRTNNYDGLCSHTYPSPSYSPYFNINDYPGTLYTIKSEEDRRKFILPSDSTVIACDKIYKRELLQTNNLVFNEKTFYGEPPFSHMVRLCATNYFVLPTPLYYYYIHSDSSSHTFPSRRLDMSRAYDTYITLTKKYGFYEKYKDEIDFIYWNGCFFLPLFNSASMNLFHTTEELNTIFSNARLHVQNIKENQYFLQHFSELKILGDLISVPINNDTYKDIKELFYLITHQ